MPFNKLALIRIHTIDNCLTNRRRKWTLEDLIDKVSEALYDCEGIQSGVSRRTIQADIQLMRSNKLGYNAPIVVLEKKYYTYENADYTIAKTPMSKGDLDKLREVVGVLKQFSVFDHFAEMQEAIAVLDNRLAFSNQENRLIIQFEDNKQTKGLSHIPLLYECISQQKVVEITYQSFQATDATTALFSPYLLKEYRNRWFVFVKQRHQKHLQIMALDRIVELQKSKDVPFDTENLVDFTHYFDDAIGVSKMPNEKPHKVVLHVNSANAPYLLTKPLHHSQVVLSTDETGITIQLTVVLNHELSREILGFGDGMTVRSPRFLLHRMRKTVERMAESYKE